MKILKFIGSKSFGLLIQVTILITIIFMSLFKENLTNNDLGSLIFFSMIYLAEEIKIRTDYYEKKEQEDDSKNS
jgi:hypothetical protein